MESTLQRGGPCLVRGSCRYVILDLLNTVCLGPIIQCWSLLIMSYGYLFLLRRCHSLMRTAETRFGTVRV